MIYSRDDEIKFLKELIVAKDLEILKMKHNVECMLAQFKKNSITFPEAPTTEVVNEDLGNNVKASDHWLYLNIVISYE